MHDSVRREMLSMMAEKYFFCDTTLGDCVTQNFKVKAIHKAIEKRNIVCTIRSLTVFQKVKELTENNDDG